MEAIVNNIRLSYSDRGEGRAVLLIHAFPLSGAMWESQRNMLERHARTIVPDLRGFGASAVPDGPYPMETYADDIAALLDFLDVRRVVLVGLSMGGYIAFAFLRRYAARIEALVLADTRAGPDNATGKAGREENARFAEAHGAAAMAEKMLPNLLAPNASSEVRETVRRIIAENDPRGIAGALRGMALRPDSTELLPAIRVPTLLLVGQEDGLTAPDVMADMQQRIDGSQLVELPGAGHLSNLEQSEMFNTTLLSFLQRL